MDKTKPALLQPMPTIPEPAEDVPMALRVALSKRAHEKMLREQGRSRSDAVACAAKRHQAIKARNAEK